MIFCSTDSILAQSENYCNFENLFNNHFKMESIFVTFPLSIPELKQLIKFYEKEDAALNEHILIKSDKIRRVDTLNRLKGDVGAYPHLQYVLACEYKILKDAVKTAIFKRKQHEERQQVWFFEGGRLRHYLKKHGRFGGDHYWLTSALEKKTGCCATDVDGESWDTEIPEVDTEPALIARKPVCPFCRCRSCTDDVCEWLLRPLDVAQEEEWELVRSPALLAKLRYLRSLLREHASPVAWQKYWDLYPKVSPAPHSMWECADPEMEGKDGESLATITSNNVVLTEENPSAPAISSVPTFRKDWHRLCTTEKTVDYSNLTDRWTFFKSAKWDVTQQSGVEFNAFNINLPCDFISSVNNDGSMPMFVPFKIHKYFNSDIELKFHINSNKFQIGQLQFSFQYLEKYDGNPLNNMYSRSQLPHVLVNAGASNEATLRIPFKYVQPYMFTSQRKNNLLPLYLGTLRCFVVVPLAVGEGGPDHCSVSMFIRFPNCNFTGMRDGSIADPQMMEAAAAMVAVKAYDKFVGDNNCDNVTQNANPNYLVPTASHSWCAGTGMPERLHSLRLDNSTVGVGRSGIDNSETSIGVPCRTFSMLKHIEWKIVDVQKNNTGWLLWSVDVHPQLEKSVYYKETVPNGLDKYALTPLCVVSSLYKQWRGSLEFKFDIVASQFHTGRLLCAYIPGFYGDASKITLAQARNSAHIEFSLQDATSFTFTVPYIANQVFWPRKFTGPHKYSEMSSPSKLVLFVLNPLIPMPSIVDKVVIVPYVRAGPDFEVSVPVQPSIGLSDNCLLYLDIKDKIFPTDGSYPMYVTNYEGFGSDKKCIYYEGTAAFGTASTFHAPERTLKSDEYFYGKAVSSSSCGTMITQNAAGEKKQSYVGYIVLWSVPDKGNYGIPFPDNADGETQANTVAKLLKEGKPVATVLSYCYNYIQDGASSASDRASLLFTPVIKKLSGISADPQMEDRFDSPNNLMPTSLLPSTSSGRFNFNEQFDDLKDLTRRYQLYGAGNLSFNTKFVSGNACIVFPAVPSGLDLDVSKDNIFNSCRDGHVPIVNSGYIYFRGSLRFKIVFSSDNIQFAGCKAWVQHHPDGDCTQHSVQAWPNIKEEDGFKSHSYSFYLQALNVNSIIEFEVPFYQPGMYGLTRKMSETAKNSDVCQYYSLGTIIIGMNTGTIANNKNFDLDYQIYYSVSDDFSLSTFRGFPMCVWTDEVWPTNIERKKKSKRNIVKITPDDWELVSADPQMEDAEPEMFSSFVNKYFRQPLVDSTSDLASDIVNKTVNDIYTKMTASVKDSVSGLDLAIDKNLVISAVFNLLHVLNNPTPSTVAISVVAVLTQLLSNKLQDAVKLTTYVTDLIKNFNVASGPSSNSADPQGDFATVSQDFDLTKILTSICGILFSSVVSLYGVSCCTPKSFPSLLSGINGSLMLSNNIIRLLTNSMDLIKFSIAYITQKLHPDKALYLKLADNIPEVKAWFEEANYLLDVRNKDRYLYDRSMLARVFDATVLGSLLVSNGLDHSSPGGKVIFDIYKDLRKMQCNLFERGAHPDVRFETYPIWISGAPGIGKSYMVKRIANDLLKAVNFTQPGSLIYDIPSGAKYWSGCSNPAVLVSDDLFQVKGTKFEDEIANLFMICSSSVLNPPMAAVEDKERRLNPLVYIMLCNSHFPTLSPTCSHPEAVYRRRKFLLYVELKDELKEKYPNFRDASQLEPHERENMGHLQFRFAFNVKDPSTEYSEWMSYEQIFKLIKEDFATHYANERDNFRQRMIDMYCLDPNFDENNMIMSLPGITEKISLKEQIETFKTYIASKLDEYQDPQRDPTAWDYINKFCEKVKRLNPCGSPQMVEPEPSAPFVEHDKYFKHLIDSQPLKEYRAPAPLEPFPYAPSIGKAYAAFEKDVLPNFIPKTVYTFEKLNELLKIKDTQPLGVLIDGFNDDNGNWLDQRIEQQVYEMFPDIYENKDIWINNALIELIEIGKFDVLDTLKLLFSWHNGMHTFVKIMFPDHYAEIYDKVKLLPYICKDKTIHKDIFLDTQDSKAGTWAHICKKANYRYFFTYCPHFRNPEELFCTFFALCISGTLLVTETQFAKVTDYIDQNFSEQLRPLLNASSYSECHKQIRNFGYYVKAHIEQKLYRGKNIELDILQGLALFVRRVVAYFCFCAVIIGPQHKCYNWKDYNGLKANFTKAKFCSYTREIKFNGTIVTPCKNVHCMYHSKFLFSLLALGSVSCIRFDSVAFDEFKVPLEYNDIKTYLKSNKQSTFDSWVTHIIAFSKHFFFHLVPMGIQKIFHFIADYIKPVLLCLGLYFAQSYALNHVKNPVGRAAVALATMNPLSTAEGIAQYIRNDDHYRIIPSFSTTAAGPEGPNYFRTAKPKHPVKPSASLVNNAFATPQMGCDNRAQMAKTIEDNSVLVYVTWIEGDKRVTRNCRCLMIKSRWMLVLRHYFEEYQALINDGYKIDMKLFYSKNKIICNQSVDFEYLRDNTYWCSASGEAITSNFGIVELPKFCPQFKNIVSKFAKEIQTKNPPAKGDLYVINGQSSFDLNISIVDNFRVNKTENSSEVFCQSVFKYNKQYKGLCGSCLVSPTLGSGNGGIIGIHIAGSDKSGDGYAEPIYQDLFDKFFAAMEGKTTPMPEEAEMKLEPLTGADPKLSSNLMMYGCVEPKFAHKESGKSKIVPSLLHGTIYEVKTEVNPLRPNDPRQPPGSHPLRDGCDKHGSGDVTVFDSSLVAVVAEHLKDRFVQLVRPIRCKIEPLSWQQAVCGDTMVPYFEPLNWKSSEGFPLSSHRPKTAHDKRWLFDLEENKEGYILKGFHPALSSQLNGRDALFLAGKKPPTVYVDCLKDYRLTPEKCALPGKTRIFSIAPIQCSLDIRKHVNDFCASIKNTRIVNSIGIGINPDSLEWTALVNYLFEVGKNIVTLDYSNYGPCLMSQLVDASNSVIVNWFKVNGASEAHTKRVEWLLDNDILNPVHLCGNVVYQTLNGIASGSPLTGECNSIPNLFYIRLVYLEIMLEHFPEHASMFYFDRLVRIVVYGDDLIMSVDDSIKDLFNGISIQNYLAKHGIKVTPAQKSQAMVPYTSIYDATFLKRSFIEHPTRTGIWLAPIEKQSIEECINWIHVCDDPQAATLESCRASLDLAFSQGPVYYKEHYNKIRTALNSIGLVIEHKPWSVRDNEIFGEAEQIIEDLTKVMIKIDLPWYYGLSKESL